MSSCRKVFYLMPFPRKIHQQTPFKMIETHKTVLLTVKKNQQNSEKTHLMAMNEWKNIRCMLYKADKPRLRSMTKNICFLILISAVTLKLMVKITSIFGSYRLLRIAWHDIFSLSHHCPAHWNLYIPHDLTESKKKCSSSCQPNPEVNHHTHLKDSSVSFW